MKRVTDYLTRRFNLLVGFALMFVLVLMQGNVFATS